jgi:hypothetical protein
VGVISPKNLQGEKMSLQPRKQPNPLASKSKNKSDHDSFSFYDADSTTGWVELDDSDSSPDEDALDFKVGEFVTVKARQEDRKSNRAPVPRDKRSCELQVAGKLVPALLMDSSEGGFSILVESLDNLKIGKKVNLHLDENWVTVRIVYINKTARPKDANSQCESWFRLGVKKARRFFF